MSITDYPIVQLNYQNHVTPWWETKRAMETRFDWGHYYIPRPTLSPTDPIIGWIATGLPSSTSMEELRCITEALKENIDNVWEGPIGYMGVWKFRFTDEYDVMAFKLLK